MFEEMFEEKDNNSNKIRNRLNQNIIEYIFKWKFV